MNDDDLARLVRWVEDGGGRLPQLAVRDGQTGRAGFATGPIARGAQVLWVPRSLLLTRDAAAASPIGAEIARAGVRMASAHSLLAAFLLDERDREGSPWAPYVRALPPSFDEMPICFADRMLALLDGTAALDRLARQRSTMVADHTVLCERVAGFDRFSLESFVWARLAVLTRVFAISIDGHPTSALVPIADMLNHRRPRETTWSYDDATAGFAVMASTDFTEGEEVHDSYGDKSNGRFFVNYGFALPWNGQDEAILAVARPSGGSMLWPSDGSPQRFLVRASLRDPRVRRMLSFLRLAFDYDERRVLASMERATDEALARYPTTLEQDEEMLGDPSWPSVVRSLLLVRVGELRVLRAWRVVAVEAGRLLALAPAALARAVTERATERATDEDETDDTRLLADYLSSLPFLLSG